MKICRHLQNVFKHDQKAEQRVPFSKWKQNQTSPSTSLHQIHLCEYFFVNDRRYNFEETCGVLRAQILCGGGNETHSCSSQHTHTHTRSYRESMPFDSSVTEAQDIQPLHWLNPFLFGYSASHFRDVTAKKQWNSFPSSLISFVLFHHPVLHFSFFLCKSIFFHFSSSALMFSLKPSWSENDPHFSFNKRSFWTVFEEVLSSESFRTFS